jgi:hypothetical protein
VPLAICDQRSLDEGDWVETQAVAPGGTERVPFLSSLYNPGQRWYYLSDMTPDEMIIFKAWDGESNVPFGCCHGAFRNLDVPRRCRPADKRRDSLLLLLRKLRTIAAPADGVRQAIAIITDRMPSVFGEGFQEFGHPSMVKSLQALTDFMPPGANWHWMVSHRRRSPTNCSASGTEIF